MSWAQAAAAGGQMIGQYFATKSAKKKAKKLGKAQAALIMAETNENVRRMKLMAEQTLGLTKSKIAASNLIMSGSTKNYFNELDIQIREDIQQTKKIGQLRAYAARKGGGYTASTIQAQGTAAMIGSLSQIGVSAWSAYSSSKTTATSPKPV